MSIKTKLDTTDEDAKKIDFQLFSTVDEVVKDIQIDDQTVIKIKIKEEKD